jgi:hypothetical protein
MHVYLLLDRTGSMRRLWTEALGAVNGYVEEFAKGSGPADAVTLAVFDSLEGLKFDVLRRAAHPLSWTPVTDAEASPRGQTPLFDAIARIVALAEADAPQKAVIAIMTDGEENASREVSRDAAKAALDAARAKDWQVVFLGADFARFDDASAVGVAGAQAMAVAPGQMEDAMRSTARKSRDYAEKNVFISYSHQDRAVAGEDKVKGKKS